MTTETDNWNEDLRGEAPLLHAIGKQAPFVVEPDFFERFPHQVQALANKPTPSRRVYWLKRGAFAIPALAVLAFAFHTLRPADGKPSATLYYDDQLMFSIADQMGTEDIIEQLGNEDRSGLEAVAMQLTPEEAGAYLDENQIDLNEYQY